MLGGLFRLCKCEALACSQWRLMRCACVDAGRACVTAPRRVQNADTPLRTPSWLPETPAHSLALADARSHDACAAAANHSGVPHAQLS